MMHEISGADREPRISRGRLHEDLLEWRLIENFPIGHAIERHAAGQAHRLLLGSGVQRAKHFEQDFFQARLQRGRAVAMHLFDRSRGIARGPQALGHVVGKHRAEFGSLIGVAPGHLRAGAMMLEILEAQAEADASVGADDAAELLQVGRLAVGGQAHDFVFVAEFAKSQILRDGRVIHAQRMGKRNRARRCACDCPGRSPTSCWRNRRARPRRAARPGRTAKRKTCWPDAPGDARRGGYLARILSGATSNACASASGIPTNRAITFALSRAKLGIFRAYRSFVPRRAQGLRGMAMWSTSRERDACGVQAIADGRRRKPRRVLHAVKAFFFDGGDQAAVRNDRRGGIAVVGIDSKDVHPEWFSLPLRPRIRGGG